MISLFGMYVRPRCPARKLVLLIPLLVALPMFSEAALSEHFEGSTLPAGWSFSDPLGSGSSNAVTGSNVEITIPSGVNTDTISSVGSSDNSVGITHAVTPGDIDIAVQVDTDISQFEDLSLNLLFFGSTTASASRFSVYQQGQPRSFAFTRAGGTGSAVGPNALSSTNDWFQGLPAWLRVSYASSTGAWTFYGSTDGATWDEILQTTRSFDVESFKVSLTSFSSLPGGSVKVNRVVDLDALGTTDVREALPSYERSTILSFTGSDGALPAGLSFDNASSGTSTWTGSALRLTSDMGVDGSRARLAYSGTTYEESGTLAQIQFQSLNSNLYGVSGIGRDTGGIDQYAQGPAYAWELAPQTNRVIVRVDEPGTANTSFNDQYTFLINESDFNLRGTPGPLFWTRVERVDGRIRARLWQDGTAEPSTWDYDGQDEIVDGPYGPVLGLSHNDGTSGGPESMDIRSFEFYEITEPDTTAPTVAVATPTNGATVSGANVALEATATDNESVAGVTFYVDNTLVGSEVTATSGPDTFTISFDSTSLADGDYAVYAVARDVAGNYATSSSVTVDVDNEPEEVEETESRGSSASATRVGERRSVSKSSENPGDTSETTVASSAPIEVSFPVRTTDRVHVRSVPGGTSLGLQPAGAVGAYGSQAPAIADSYIWNYVDFTNGPDGWVAKPFTEYAQEGEGLSTPAQRIELSLHLIALLQLILELQTELDALQAAEA